MFIKNLSKLLLKTSIMCASMAPVMMSLNATADMIPKPGKPSNSAEFGRAVAQNGIYTLASAEQDALLAVDPLTGQVEARLPVLVGSFPAQGSVHVFEGRNAIPKATYQFPGDKNSFMRLGHRIAMSDKWLAFTATNSTSPYHTTLKPAQVFIVGKDANGQWKTCPSGISGVDCANSVDINGVENRGRALKSINFELTADEAANVNDPGFPDSLSAKNLGNQTIAISDKYLAMANNAAGIVNIYGYDAMSNQWLLESRLDYSGFQFNFGTAMAIDGDTMMISAPNGRGIVYRVSRNNINKTWAVDLSRTNSDVTVKHFGQTLDIHLGNIVVGAETADGRGLLSFFKNVAGEFSDKSITTTDFPPSSVSLFGDTVVAGIGSAANSYKFNATSNTWPLAQSNVLEFGVPVGIVGLDFHSGTIVSGWLGYRTTTADLVGAIIVNDLLKPNCKLVANNLVPNCSFDVATNTPFPGTHTTSGWSVIRSNGANGSIDYQGNQILATMTSTGSNAYNFQTRAKVSFTTAGNYTLSFKASAASNRQMEINVSRNGTSDNNWQNYGGKKYPQLTPTMQTFSYQLNGVPVNTNAVLDFNFGNAGNAAVTIDEVTLVKNP